MQNYCNKVSETEKQKVREEGGRFNVETTCPAAFLHQIPRKEWGKIAKEPKEDRFARKKGL